MNLGKSEKYLEPEKAFDIRIRIGKFLEQQGAATIAPGAMVASGGATALTTASATIGAVGSGGHTVMNAVMMPITGVAKTAIGVGVCMAVVGSAEIALGNTFEAKAEQRTNKYKGLEDVILNTVEKTVKKESKTAIEKTREAVTHNLENRIAKILHREVKNIYGRHTKVDAHGEAVEVTHSKENKGADKNITKSHFRKTHRRKTHFNYPER